MKTKAREMSEQYDSAVEQEASKHLKEVKELKREQVALEEERSSLQRKLKAMEGERDVARKLLKLEGDASMAAEAKAKQSEEESQRLRDELESLREPASQMFVDEELLKAHIAHESKISKAQLDAALIETQITTYGKVLDGKLSISQMRNLHRSATEFLPKLEEVVAKLIAESPIPAPPIADEAGTSSAPREDLPDGGSGHPDDVDSS